MTESKASADSTSVVVSAPTHLKGSLFHTLTAATLNVAMEQDRKHMIAAWKSQPPDKRSTRPTWPQHTLTLTSTDEKDGNGNGNVNVNGKVST